MKAARSLILTRGRFHPTALPDRVLARLREEGGQVSGGATLGGMAKLLMEACRNCGKTRWWVDVLWQNVNSADQSAAQARAERGS